MRHKPPDMVLLFLVLFLTAVGIAMVVSASASTSISIAHGDPYYFVKRQCLWLVIGFGGMALAYRLDLRFLRALTPWIFAAAAVSLALVLLPRFGLSAGGARRWLGIGPFGFEPSELAKVSVVLFAAWFPTRRPSLSISFSKTFLPLLILVLPILALVFKEPDFGTCVLLFGVFAVMICIAGMRLSHMAGLAGLAVPAGVYLMSRAKYRQERLTAFIHPWKDPLGSGYHIIQGLIALGSGGFLGVGLGAGLQKFYYLPEQHTDYIFAVLGEEGGFLATGMVVILFLLVAARGMSIALKQKDSYGRLLAAGLTTLLAGQAVLNMAMVVSLVPPAGVALPFISYGGSSLLSAMISAGLLLNLSKAPQRKQDEILQEKIFIERN